MDSFFGCLGVLFTIGLVILFICLLPFILCAGVLVAVPIAIIILFIVVVIQTLRGGDSTGGPRS